MELSLQTSLRFLIHFFYRNKRRKQASFWLHKITKNSSPGANCQIGLLFTERYQSQKPESV